jgi:hypothetical protein
MGELSAQEKKEIADMVVAALQRSRTISEHDHAKHHRFVDSLIEREKRKSEIWEQVKIATAKTGAIAIFGAVLTLIGLGLREWFRRNLSGD